MKKRYPARNVTTSRVFSHFPGVKTLRRRGFLSVVRDGVTFPCPVMVVEEKRYPVACFPTIHSQYTKRYPVAPKCICGNVTPSQLKARRRNASGEYSQNARRGNIFGKLQENARRRNIPFNRPKRYGVAGAALVGRDGVTSLLNPAI